MLGDNGYYAPVGYSAIWVAIAVGVLALTAAWYVFLWLFLRRRRSPRPSAVPDIEPADLAARYGRLIDDVVRAHESGQLSGRAAHQKLSLIVRLHAQEASGVPASVMTLADLSEAKLTRVADTVAEFYPAEFRSISDGDVADAAALARRTVSPWS